ncbi:MAG: porin family protein [Hyphomicrobiaceae bacterium]|nr:porin family protein [Hyphomicrobiaceae bacterium]
MTNTIAASAICAFAAIATITPAGAADLGPYRPRTTSEAYVDAPAVYNWRGFYAGLNGGYAWGSGDATIVRGGVANGALDAIDPDGWLGGAQIGYNAQFGAFVLGAEADLIGGDVSGGSGGVIGAGIPAASSSELNWLSTVRARAGLSADRVMFYVTAGVAWADMDFALAAADGTFAAGSNTLVGYALGGGVEWALSPNWSVKAEYLYIDLENSRIAGFDGGGTPITADFDNAFHTMRVGLNYRF